MRDARPDSRLPALSLGCALPLVVYCGAYVFVRLTHGLVNYGSFIAAPDAMRRIGFTWTELLFAPLTFLEETVRFL